MAQRGGGTHGKLGEVRFACFANFAKTLSRQQWL